MTQRLCSFFVFAVSIQDSPARKCTEKPILDIGACHAAFRRRPAASYNPLSGRFIILLQRGDSSHWAAPPFQSPLPSFLPGLVSPFPSFSRLQLLYSDGFFYLVCCPPPVPPHQPPRPPLARPSLSPSLPQIAAPDECKEVCLGEGELYPSWCFLTASQMETVLQTLRPPAPEDTPSDRLGAEITPTGDIWFLNQCVRRCDITFYETSNHSVLYF